MGGVPDTRSKGKEIGASSDRLAQIEKARADRERLLKSHGFSQEKRPPIEGPQTPVELQQSRKPGEFPKLLWERYAWSPHSAWTAFRWASIVASIGLAWLVATFFTNSPFIGMIITGFFSWHVFLEDKWQGRGEFFDWLDGKFRLYLPSRDCPECGQSIFDQSEGEGYVATVETQSYFPARTCCNCGYDLTQSEPI